MNTLTAAFKYLNAGLAVIPIWRDARKNPHISTFTEYHQQLPTHWEWRRWANRWPSCNIGLITGYWNNYIALDFDDHESYRCWCESAGFGLRGQTWTVATRRGYHVWFQSRLDPHQSRNYVCQCGQGHSVLLRAKGGYCIVPPSIHHSGTPYRTVHKIPVMTIDTPEQLFRVGWAMKQRKKPVAANVVSLGVNQAGVRIEDLVEPIGNPNGRGAFKAFCPFHDDSTPSAWVNPEQQRFGCNAEGCLGPGLWWDVANVYAKLKGISNEQALREVRG